jgi:hypothetical protein
LPTAIASGTLHSQLTSSSSDHRLAHLVQLDRAVALIERLAAVARDQRFVRIAQEARIGGEALAARSAEQRVQRLPGRLAREVP